MRPSSSLIALALTVTLLGCGGEEPPATAPRAARVPSAEASATAQQQREQGLPAIPGPDHLWGVRVLKVDDALLIARCNQSAKQWAGRPELPIRLGLAIPLRSPNPGGIISPEESQQLAPVEDAIVACVGARTSGVHVLTLTNGVMKEFVFYVPQGTDCAAIHAAAQGCVKTHDVQCLAREDPEWTVYRAFATEP
jgi:hypothetical protein